MPIVEFDGAPSWSLDASKTGESTKRPWVREVGLIAWGEVAEKITIFSDRRAFHHPYPRAFFIHIWDRTEK